MSFNSGVYPLLVCIFFSWPVHYDYIILKFTCGAFLPDILSVQYFRVLLFQNVQHLVFTSCKQNILNYQARARFNERHLFRLEYFTKNEQAEMLLKERQTEVYVYFLEEFVLPVNSIKGENKNSTVSCFSWFETRQLYPIF